MICFFQTLTKEQAPVALKLEVGGQGFVQKKKKQNRKYPPHRKKTAFQEKTAVSCKAQLLITPAFCIYCEELARRSQKGCHCTPPRPPKQSAGGTARTGSFMSEIQSWEELSGR